MSPDDSEVLLFVQAVVADGGERLVMQQSGLHFILQAVKTFQTFQTNAEQGCIPQ